MGPAPVLMIATGIRKSNGDFFGCLGEIPPLILSLNNSSFAVMKPQGILLLDLRPGHENRCIRVRASRVCHYLGDFEDTEVIELKIVLIDEKGDSIYAIVPHNLVRFYIQIIHETGMYHIAVFEVLDRQRIMSPVENPLVIMVWELTKAQLILPQDYPKKFPEWTYWLTPISDLLEPASPPTQYIGVMGVIRGISDVVTLNMPGRNILVRRRHVPLDDGGGNKVRVTLWGEDAFRLNGRVIRFLGDDRSAAISFVALTVSMDKAQRNYRVHLPVDGISTKI